ncbi:polysaccharide pyruvyl transferase family protein [Microbacterium sp. Sa4CUA7]|uniref:Polysaccharide pyruvyl transferase family protein n=1 Tax=Microbacterium pullorum TaxID=2762236 RepID=A0ABR8S152_9MICO|nr:polysaccharide pyruvyl transferase family protein [Microbacterium pullorum]MBD7957216.1 polysaccharide pyruvyl transferase family protein [Microbacterium pullorum]
MADERVNIRSLTGVARTRLNLLRAGEPRRQFYLVSPAGVPNFGDELLARAWLDWLAARHPQADVWLDCIEPGRAAHLFRDTHPRLRVTNTLWQLAHGNAAGVLKTDAQRARDAVVELGTPRLDLGLEAMRSMSSIHVLGGGYLNTLWPLNLSILSALASLKSTFGTPLFATGQGFLPQNVASAELIRPLLAQFDYVESRDAEGAQLFDVREGLDDAFLAFANKRAVFAEYETPDVMVLVQGDFFAPGSEERVVRAIDAFASRYARGRSIGFAEALPPDDARFVTTSSDTLVFPFMRMWQEGVPARPGQTWLASRFHFHFLAAAAGAKGVAISGAPGYYDVKHASMQRTGTGWPIESAEQWMNGRLPEPGVNPGFAKLDVPRLAARKAALAESLYG